MIKKTLIVSDLHLGKDIKTTINGEIAIVDQPRIYNGISSFLDHYTNTNTTWSLIINGDMIDFMSLVVYPNDKSYSEDGIFGLGTGCDNTKIKLQIVMKFHSNIFKSLAKFILVGNTIDIVVGNHDAELSYKPIQELFIQELYQINNDCSCDFNAFKNRINFHEWFYYDGQTYAEHGHQYDEYCSTDYLLAIDEKSGIVPSVSHFGMRYFANKVSYYNPDVAEKWGFLEYVKWAYVSGLKNLTSALYYYSILVLKTFLLWNSLRKTDKERKTINKNKIHNMRSILNNKQLTKLYSLRRLPVTRNLFNVIGTYFIDRMLLATIAFVAPILFYTYLHHHWKFVVPISFLLFSYLLNLLFNKIRFNAPSSIKLRAAAKKIKNVVSAKFITCGHSHEPETIAMGATTYINTGSWVENGRLTYAIITEEEQGLKYWQLTDK